MKFHTVSPTVKPQHTCEIERTELSFAVHTKRSKFRGCTFATACYLVFSDDIGAKLCELADCVDAVEFGSGEEIPIECLCLLMTTHGRSAKC